MNSKGAKGTSKLVNKFVDKADSEIWHEFVKGDDDAFVFIYNKYINKLLRFGVQFAPRETVKDSIQDLFLHFKKSKKNKPISKISPYLYKALYRIIKAKIDASKRAIDSYDEMKENKSWQVYLPADTNLIASEQQKEQSHKLSLSLNQLSEKQRQAILLYYYEGLTHEEIKDIMGLRSKSSVRKLIHRGLDALKSFF